MRTALATYDIRLTSRRGNRVSVSIVETQYGPGASWKTRTSTIVLMREVDRDQLATFLVEVAGTAMDLVDQEDARRQRP